MHFEAKLWKFIISQNDLWSKISLFCLKINYQNGKNIWIMLQKILFFQQIFHEISRKFTKISRPNQSRESNVSWNVWLKNFVNREIKPREKVVSNVNFPWQTFPDSTLVFTEPWFHRLRDLLHVLQNWRTGDWPWYLWSYNSRSEKKQKWISKTYERRAGRSYDGNFKNLMPRQ